MKNLQFGTYFWVLIWLSDPPPPCTGAIIRIKSLIIGSLSSTILLVGQTSKYIAEDGFPDALLIHINNRLLSVLIALISALLNDIELSLIVLISSAFVLTLKDVQLYSQGSVELRAVLFLCWWYIVYTTLCNLQAEERKIKCIKLFIYNLVQFNTFKNGH